MERSIDKVVEKHELIKPGDRVLIGVSGGPDSMALLHWLWKHQGKYQIDILAVHVNHQLRGIEADKDQQYVEETCQSWDIPCISKKAEVSHYAQEHQLSKQVAARECRFAIFREVAQEFDRAKLALAHHADDQVETVVMRLVRGAGLAGLSGMPLTRETECYTIIRPFMAVSKKEIEQYCQLHDLQPRLDKSNESDEYTRNWVRHHVTPLLHQMNPNIHQVIYETTEILRMEDEFLAELASHYTKKVIESKSMNKMSINLYLFEEIPLPLQSRVILLILDCLPIHKRDWNRVHIHQILELIKNREGNKQVMLPHQVLVIREYSFLHVIYESLLSATESLPIAYGHILPQEGEVFLPEVSLRIQVIRQTVEAGDSLLGGHRADEGKQVALWEAYFNEEEIVMPLMIRNRRPGDRIQPLGMDGHKKVKDIFIDEKVPASLRQTWPIIEDQNGILWIPGLKKAARGKVTHETKKIIKMHVQKKGTIEH